MRVSLTQALRNARGFMRLCAAVVAAAVLNAALAPFAFATSLSPAPRPSAVSHPRDNPPLPKTLDRLLAALERLEGKLSDHRDIRVEAEELSTLFQTLPTHDTEILREFDRIERHIREKGLPAVLLTRHEKALADYRREMAAVIQNLTELAQAADDRDRLRQARKARAT